MIILLLEAGCISCKKDCDTSWVINKGAFVLIQCSFRNKLTDRTIHFLMYSSGPKIRVLTENYFSYFSTKTNVVGAQ